MSAANPSNAGSSDIARLHLQWAGQQQTVAVTFQQGEQTLRELLPVARELAQHLTAMSIESVARQGRTVSCRAGCGACCRQLICISLVEAQALADLVAALPPERQAVIRRRFADAVAQLEAAGLLDPREPKGNRRLISAAAQTSSQAIRGVAMRYFQQQIACPFLEHESCTIYAERPLVCREYHVTSPPEHCARLYEIEVAPVETPIRMGDVMVQVGHEIAGASLEAIPLVLALEWAEAHPAALTRQADGLQLLAAMMTRIDKQCSQAFEERKN